MDTVPFPHIVRILEVTDRLGLSREWVEIPLSTASPGSVKKLPNGKVEIVVDAEVPFDEWLAALEGKIQALMNEEPPSPS
ncbi:MAG: hypothetical protein D6690_02880 [Nitrospirae bacterium]|nr:MAG: hypothetical protein D6690_02880 [Nitrospirota bacterium]